MQFASYGGWDSYRAYLREAKAGKALLHAADHAADILAAHGLRDGVDIRRVAVPVGLQQSDRMPSFVSFQVAI